MLFSRYQENKKFEMKLRHPVSQKWCAIELGFIWETTRHGICCSNTSVHFRDILYSGMLSKYTLIKRYFNRICIFNINELND